MRKEITREQLDNFGHYCIYVLNLKHDEQLITFPNGEFETYCGNIYLQKNNPHNYISWNENANYETLLKVVDLLNTLTGLELELIV